jgi:hypothetical protein
MVSKAQKIKLPKTTQLANEEFWQPDYRVHALSFHAMMFHLSSDSGGI